MPEVASAPRRSLACRVVEPISGLLLLAAAIAIGKVFIALVTLVLAQLPQFDGQVFCFQR
jgi:hypothetical protein